MTLRDEPTHTMTMDLVYNYNINGMGYENHMRTGRHVECSGNGSRTNLHRALRNPTARN